MMTDPIADMLTRIRNAIKVEKVILDVPYSKIKEGVVDVLKREGYIWSYQVVEGSPANTIRIQLKYSNSGERVIRSIRKISKPGRRCYASPKDLKPVLNGLGIYVLSTNKGVISDREAREQNVGGEIICEIW
ncbi:MAG: 30S ribosomal protein S8 [Thermoguttaceae bacterium]|nr:30S ribosomal protein S8 [Thermoguttaceae bacterium]